MLYNSLPPVICFIPGSIYTLVLLSQFVPPSSFSSYVHTFLLYACISILALQIDSSEPFFYKHFSPRNPTNRGNRPSWFPSSPSYLMCPSLHKTINRLQIKLDPSQVVLAVKNPPAKAGDKRDLGLIPGSGRSFGGGNGNPLQYFCLENPMGRRAWRATVHRITKSQTQLKQLSKQDIKRSICTRASPPM